VKRSQSDVTLHSTRRPKNRKQRGETPFEKTTSKSRDSQDSHSRDSRGDSYTKESYDPYRQSRTSSDGYNRDRTTVVEVHKQKKPAPPPPKPKPKKEDYVNPPTNLHDPELTESATDSAKLRAIERERGRERERERNREIEDEMKKGRKRMQDEKDKKASEDYKSSFMRDNYGYVSDGNTSVDLNVRPYNYEGQPVQQSSAYESSVVARMAALTDTPKPVIIRQGESNMHVDTPRTFHAEVTKKLEKLKDTGRDGRPVDIADGPMATSTGKHSRSSRPASGKERRRSRRESTVTDQDGKQTQP